MMQLGVGQVLFPSWTAATTLVKDHGVSAAEHALAAVRAGDGSTRLDEAVRAMTSFDHAIDNTRKLPVQWFVRGAAKYYRGYEVAHQAVKLLVASGLIPGARERVGRQSLLAAKETFLAGVDASEATKGRYRRFLAGGWLEATAEDALDGVALLKSGDLGKQLLAGVSSMRAAIGRGAVLDPERVRAVSDLFDRAAAQLHEQELSAGSSPVVRNEAAFARAGELLVQVHDAAQALVANADDALAHIESRA